MQASDFLFFAVLVIAVVFVMTEVTTFLRAFVLVFSIPSDVHLEYQAAVAGLEVIEARRVPKAQRRTFSERRYTAWGEYFRNSIVFHAMIYKVEERKYNIAPSLAVASVSAIGFAYTDLFGLDALCLAFLGGAVTFMVDALPGYLKHKAEVEAFNNKCKEVLKAVRA